MHYAICFKWAYYVNWLHNYCVFGDKLRRNYNYGVPACYKKAQPTSFMERIN